MSDHTHDTAPTQFVEAGGIRFAYRRFGNTIDYQPSQLAGVRSMDRDLLLKNAVSTAKIAKLFGVPIVHSTINVKTGQGKPTLPPLAEVLADYPPIVRTTTNAWEDPDFLNAVRATGRRKLIICAL